MVSNLSYFNFFLLNSEFSFGIRTPAAQYLFII